MHNKFSDVIALFTMDPHTSKMHAQEQIQLDLSGVRGDKHYDKEPNRSVLITSLRPYEMAKELGIEMPYGALGENILLDCDLHTLQPGMDLLIGEAVVRIAQNCTLCTHLCAIDPRLPKLLKHDRGIFARVVKGATVHLGDGVYRRSFE